MQSDNVCLSVVETKERQTTKEKSQSKPIIKGEERDEIRKAFTHLN
jgi:hypothetical protein